MLGDDVPGNYAAYEAGVGADNSNLYKPFAHKLDWEIAQWAKLHKIGANSLDSLLGLEGLQDLLQLSFKNSRELNLLIDKDLPHNRPRFIRGEIRLEESSEVYDVFYRDVIQCIKALYGDEEFARYLVFTPEKHFSDAAHSNRLYHDLHTGNWWWTTQVNSKNISKFR